MRLLKLFDFYFAPRIVFPLLLIILSFLVIFFSKPYLQGDEERYLNFSQNLLNGFYANPDLKPGFLWNGPGYPLLIAPIKFLKLPLIVYRILNIILIFLGSYFLYKILLHHFTKSQAALITFIGSVTHPYIFDAVTRILTESFSFFLINLFIFSLANLIETQKSKYLFICSFSGGFLMLTKVFFSYVFLALLLVSIVLSFFKKMKYLSPKIFFYPFIICLPYLTYTYSLTGKYFYWSDAGGSSLYSMSTPFENEYGDWFSANIDFENQKVRILTEQSRTTIPKGNDTYYEDHVPFLLSINNKSGVERDSLLKEKAIQNIIENPFKFSKNIIWNISRIFLRTPFTDRELKKSFKFIFYTHGLALIIGYLISVISMFFINKDKLTIGFLIFISITLFGTSMLSAESRFLFPIYGIFIALIFIQLKNISFWINQRKSQL